MATLDASSPASGPNPHPSAGARFDVEAIPETYRNSRPILAAMLACAAITCVMAPGFAIIAIAAIFPIHGFGFSRLIEVIAWAAAANAALATGLLLWRRTMRMYRNSARFAPDGVYLRLNGIKNEAETFFPWSSIRRITHERSGNNIQIYSIFGTDHPDDPAVSFSSLTFIRPKLVARRIAQGAGIDIG